MVAVSDQMRKEVENLGFDRHEVISPAQLAAARVKRVILEKVQQFPTPGSRVERLARREG